MFFLRIVCYLFNDVSVSDVVCLTLILHNPRCEYFRKLKFLCIWGGGIVGYLMTLYQPQRLFECDIPYERMILFSSLAD